MTPRTVSNLTPPTVGTGIPRREEQNMVGDGRLLLLSPHKSELNCSRMLVKDVAFRVQFFVLVPSLL